MSQDAELIGGFSPFERRKRQALASTPSMPKTMHARRTYHRTFPALCALSLLVSGLAHAADADPGAARSKAGADGGQKHSAAAAPEAAAPKVEAAVPVPLATRLQRLAARGPKHLEVLTPVREEQVSASRELRREVVVSAERCYHVLVAVDSPEVEVDAALVDGAGVILARAKGKEDQALPAKASFCPTASGPVALTLRAASDVRVAWQLIGGANPKLAERFPVGGEGKELVSVRMRDVHRNQGAKTPVMAFTAGTLETAAEHTVQFEAQSGSCYLLVASGVPSLRALDLEVLDQRGNNIARSSQQASIAIVKACADLTGVWTLRTRAFKGYGAFGVQAFIAP